MNSTLNIDVRPVGLLIAVGIFICCLTIMGLFGEFSWMLDLTSHFPMQYAVLLSGTAIALVFFRKYKISATFGAVALFNAYLLSPQLLPAGESPLGTATALRVMLANIHTSNDNYDSLIESVYSENPDFIILEEVNDVWMQKLKALNTRYPYVVSNARSDNFGMAFFSKHPFVKHDVLYLGSAWVPSIVGYFSYNGVDFAILGTHTLPPSGNENFEFRNEQFAGISEFANQCHTPLLIIGDLNVSPWSFYFRKLIRDGNLQDSSLGRGLQYTWPATNVLFPLRVPLDHCLYSRNVNILNREILSNIGSDHYPLIVDFTSSSEPKG